VERFNRKEQEKHTRKKDILEAALVLFSEKSYHEVTVDEIAKRVGLSKGTLYLYFDTKENLFFSIIQEKTEALFSRLQSAIQDNAPYLHRLENFIKAYFAFFEEYQAYFKIIHSEKRRMEVPNRNRMRNHITKSYYDYDHLLLNFMKEGQDRGLFRDMKPEIITNTLRGLLNSFIFQCVFTEEKCSLVEEAPYVLDLFLNGVKNEESTRRSS